MREEFGLHELAVEDARHGHQRPKIEEYGDSLFAVLQTVEDATGRRARRSARSTIFVGPNYVLSVRIATPSAASPSVRARCEREPRPAQARLGVRALRADGQRRRPLLPGPRRARDRARGDRGADLRQERRALEHRGALRSQAEADDAQARGRSADGSGRQALRRPRAAAVHGHAGIFPRRLRSPAADPRDDREASATCRRPRSRSTSA